MVHVRGNEPILIRQVRQGDGPAFRAIRLEAIADSPTAFGSSLAETEARPAQYWDQRVASASAGNGNVLFVAQRTGEWVGIVGSYADGASNGHSVDLISLWVRPACRGQGIGRLLVVKVVEWATAQRTHQVALWVTEGNDRALSLYIDIGFRDAGERKVHPSHPDLTEKRMVLEL